MKSTEFCYWLQGYFELRRGEAQSGMSLTHEQVEIIERHLALVFKHEIDPSYGPPFSPESVKSDSWRRTYEVLIMTDLSPITQTVWDAAWTNCPVQCGDIKGTRRSQISAALQIQFKDQLGLTAYGGHTQAQEQLLAIADELTEC
jgi:hypothetical protein